jgi:hypothetical protein
LDPFRKVTKLFFLFFDFDWLSNMIPRLPLRPVCRLIVLFLGLQSQAARLQDPAQTLQNFNTGAPSTQSWQTFFQMSSEQRAALWQSQVRLGKKLGQWAWQWRLGWLRACAQDKADFCADLLSAGLRDNALVVRSEAATILGRTFAGSGNKDALNLLLKAGGDPRNMRGGKPLFVQQRILWAIKQIGGGNAAGQRLAARHRTTKEYWSKLR